jgi:hypothetical protein
MTRDEFNRLYAVRMDNTEGYTQGQLDALNRLAFEQVADLDPEDRATRPLVYIALGRASIHYEVAQS